MFLASNHLLLYCAGFFILFHAADGLRIKTFFFKRKRPDFLYSWPACHAIYTTSSPKQHVLRRIYCSSQNAALLKYANGSAAAFYIFSLEKYSPIIS